MNTLLFKKLLAIPSLALMFSLTALGPVSADSSPSMTITNSGTTLTNNFKTGSTFSFVVNEDSGSTPVNVAVINLDYGTSYLQYVGSSFSGTAFGLAVSNDGGSGSIHIIRGTTTPVTGVRDIATVTFKAINPGATHLTLVSGSNLANDGNSLNPSLGSFAMSLSGSSTSGSNTQSEAVAAPAVSTTTTTNAPSAAASLEDNSAATTTTSLNLTTKSNSAVSLPSNTTAKVSTNVTVVPEAVSSNPVREVNYYLNNKLVSSTTTAPYSYSLNVANTRDGTYKLSTKTFYTTGKIALTSNEIKIANGLSSQQVGLQIAHLAYIILPLLVLIGFALWARRSLINHQMEAITAASTAPGPLEDKPAEATHEHHKHKHQVPDPEKPIIIYPDKDHRDNDHF
jgi:hypothetical protein